MIVQTYARLAGLLIGSRFQVNIQPAAKLPFIASLLNIGHLDSLQITAIPTNDYGPAGSSSRIPLLPMQVATLSSSSPSSTDGQQGVSLGWKPPALLLAPFWILLLLSTRRIASLFLLLLTWLKVPNYGASGILEWEGIVDAKSLNRGVLWRFLLGRVLDDIARSSLPGMLASLNPDGSANPDVNLPRSICRGVKVANGGRGGGGGKLVLKGQLQSFQLQMPGVPNDTITDNISSSLQLQRRGRRQQAGNGNGTGTVLTPPISPQPPVTVSTLNYTLRMGLLPGRVQTDGTTLLPIRNQDSRNLRSCLLWDKPELKLSLGNDDDDNGGWMAKLLPKIWVPTLSQNCGVRLPQGVEVQNARISEAGEGIRVGGRFYLGGEGTDSGDGEYGIVVR